MGKLQQLLLSYFSGLAVDGDGVLASSPLQEYYFDNGALFAFSAVDPVQVPGAAGDNIQQYEIVSSAAGGVRVFDYMTSSLADKYQVWLHEVGKRSLADNSDAVNIPTNTQNRLNKKTFPGNLYRLTGAAVNSSLGDPTRIYSRIFIMEEGSSHPSATDGGAAQLMSTQLLMDAENYNYIIQIRNLDEAARDFYLGVILGVPAMVGGGA